MRKLHPGLFQGTGFIRLSDLPFNQMVQLKDWLATTDIFSIIAKNGMEYYCVHYEDYDFWFDHFKCENHQQVLSLF